MSEPEKTMPNKRRYVIIIGAMKSGTTTLFSLIAQHPAIAPAKDKEPGFFAFDEIWSKGFAWFDTLFDFDPDVHRYRLEASTDYTKFPFVTGVWERMTADPDVEVKLLYIMRDPLKRIESHAQHTQRQRREVGRQDSERPDHSLDAGPSPVSLMISSYATQLSAYKTAQEAGLVHCLTLEELKTDPDKAMQKVWLFLELDPPRNSLDHSPQNVGATKTRVHPAWAFLTRNAILLRLGKSLVPDAARAWFKGLFRQKVTVSGRFKLSEEERRALSLLLAQDLSQLREEHGIDTKRLWGL